MKSYSKPMSQGKLALAATLRVMAGPGVHMRQNLYEMSDARDNHCRCSNVERNLPSLHYLFVPSLLFFLSPQSNSGHCMHELRAIHFLRRPCSLLRLS
jgi:hypothetical protein